MASLARPVLRARTPRLVARRFESSASGKTAEAARHSATKVKELQARAQEGLSRVSGAAGPAIAGAVRGVTGTLAKVGGRTGRLASLIERQTPLVVYYSKVGLELGKIVFRGQKMNPPSLATFQTYYQNLWRSLQQGTLLPSPQQLVQQARNLSSVQLAAGGVVFAECLGFFTVGEVIGRLKIVGYRGEAASHH